MTNHNPTNSRSVLAQLRALRPNREVRFDEALRIAELQAARLLTLTGVSAAPIPHEFITALPRIAVRIGDIPTSGVSFWDGQQWVITLNADEPLTRQRFTLMHEYKHIIDHGNVRALYPGTRSRSPEQQAEQAADFFAGCALMPRNLLKRAWSEGLRTPRQLSRHFDTSEPAIAVRLAQIGLTNTALRCSWPTRWTSGRYERSRLSTTTLGMTA